MSPNRAMDPDAKQKITLDSACRETLFHSSNAVSNSQNWVQEHSFNVILKSYGKDVHLPVHMILCIVYVGDFGSIKFHCCTRTHNTVIS